jgi:hypothetical protein
MSNLRRHVIEPASLSRAGEERRERFLGDLHAELDRRGARRRRTRSAIGVLVLAIAAGAVWASFPGRTQPGGGAAPVAPQPVASAGSHADAPAPVDPPTPSLISIVTTDPDVLRRLAAPPVPTSIEIISDSALQVELASAGVDPGLVIINGRVHLTLAGDTSPAAPRWEDPRPNESN